MIFNPDSQKTVLEFLALDSEDDRESFLSNRGIDEQLCEAKLKSFVDNLDPSLPTFPVTLEPSSSEEAKQLALFLVTKHMRNYRSSHCTPLPLRFFSLPWQLGKR